MASMYYHYRLSTLALSVIQRDQFLRLQLTYRTVDFINLKASQTFWITTLNTYWAMLFNTKAIKVCNFWILWQEKRGSCLFVSVPIHQKDDCKSAPAVNQLSHSTKQEFKIVRLDAFHKLQFLRHLTSEIKSFHWNWCRLSLRYSIKF